MYRQLDQRISDKEVCLFLVFQCLMSVSGFSYSLILYISCKQRSSFGIAHRMHLYSDYSILVFDYLAQGTLQVGLSYFLKSMLLVLVLCNTQATNQPWAGCHKLLSGLWQVHGRGVMHLLHNRDALYARNFAWCWHHTW